MGLWFPDGVNEAILRVSSYSGTRPPNASTEHNITMVPGSANTKGSWVEVLSDSVITSDLCWLDVWASWNNIAGVARNCVFDIGVDEAGGTTYVVLVPDVCATMADNHTLGGGIRHSFPIHIKAGSAIAIRAQSSDGGGSCGIAVRGYGRPRSGYPAFAGKYATTFGFNSGTTLGTAVTSGAASEGSWTAIATSISRAHQWWQVGMFANNTALTSGNLYHVDVAYGDASNKHIIINGQPWRITSASETIANDPMPVCFRRVPAGANLYLRAQCSGTADANLSFTLTGVGG
jgi:hypothetical protein